MKPIVAVHWVFLACWMLFECKRTTGLDIHPGPEAPAQPAGLRRRLFDVLSFKRIGLFGAGPAGIWLGTLVYFAATQRGGELISAVFEFNLGYSESSEPFFMRFVRFVQPRRHPFIFDSAMPIWFVGAVSLLVLIRDARRDRFAASLLLLLVASFIAVCLPAQFWPHYYYLLIAPLTMAAAWFVARIAGALARVNGGAWLARVAGVAVPAWLATTQGRDYIDRTPLQITEKRYNSRDFWARGHGYKAAAATDPGDFIFVFGSDAGMYYYSDRRGASRYTMLLSLRQGYPGAEQRRRTLMDELNRNRPRLILVCDEKPFEEWRRFLHDHYRCIGADHHDHRPDEVILYAFEDVDRPVRPVDWEWDRGQIGEETGGLRASNRG